MECSPFTLLPLKESHFLFVDIYLVIVKLVRTRLFSKYCSCRSVMLFILVLHYTAERVTYYLYFGPWWELNAWDANYYRKQEEKVGKVDKKNFRILPEVSNFYFAYKIKYNVKTSKSNHLVVWFVLDDALCLVKYLRKKAVCSFLKWLFCMESWICILYRYCCKDLDLFYFMVMFIAKKITS